MRISITGWRFGLPPDGVKKEGCGMKRKVVVFVLAMGQSPRHPQRETMGQDPRHPQRETMGQDPRHLQREAMGQDPRRQPKEETKPSRRGRTVEQ